METNQPNYVNSAENFANEPPMQLTLRVMTAVYTNARFWIGAVAVIAILTVAGPFDTLNDMEFAPRLVYWATIALVTWPLGMACSIYFGILTHQKGLPEIASRILGGFIGGLPIGLFVWLLNKLYFGTEVESYEDLVRLTGYTTIISAAVSLIYFLIADSPQRNAISSQQFTGSADSSPEDAVIILPAAVPFFARLPLQLGKDLISLQAQDHYIRATTTRGSEMILMRLADAETELETVPGVRTHRSWWVSKKHIAELKRENEKPFLVLSDGSKVPVSRSYLKEVRKILGD